MAVWNEPNPYTEYHDLMKQAKKYEVIETLVDVRDEIY